jgi:hypothetical protein
MNVDIIGDIHGQYEKLVGLLAHLGYRDIAGVWRHPDRQAIFVGDLIDRGPGQLATVRLVRAMVEAGTARCILGNHEFNAVAWFTPDPAKPGEFLRPHKKPGNRAQHEAFLTEVEGTPQHAEVIDWFKTLPLWLDLSGLRIVHACWHQASMDVLIPLLGPNRTLTDEVILHGSRRGDPVFEALEVVCKGPEVTLPGGMSFEDKEGKVHDAVRIAWWKEDCSTFKMAAQGPPSLTDAIPDTPLGSEWQAFRYRGPPVVFGHYWFTGTPTVLSPSLACVDYSAAREGYPLVAYRWSGEAELRSANFEWVRTG